MRDFRINENDKIISEIEEFFPKAIAATCEKDMQGQERIEILWLRFLDAMDQQGGEIRKHAFFRMQDKNTKLETTLAIYEECVRILLDGDDKQEINLLFETLEKSTVFLVTPLRIYLVTANAAKFMQPMNPHFVRKIFEKAALVHGNSITLWLEYMKFESDSSNGGDVSKLAHISWEASQKLNKADADAFEEAWQRERLMA